MDIFVNCKENTLRRKKTFHTLAIIFLLGAIAIGIIFIAGTTQAIESPIIQNKIDDQNSFEQSSKNDLKSFERCKKDAEAGIPEAQYELSIMYAFGSGTGSDKTKSTEWCQKAASAGHSDAQYDLGYKYYSGDNWVTTPDYAKALEWYQKAAHNGHAEAQWKIGIMYLHGEGVKKDDAKAFEYIKEAAENGHRLAKYRLGLMYENGKGVEKNIDQATYWYNNVRRQNELYK